MQGSFGGEVRQTGPFRLEADYPHRFITFLLILPVFFFGTGALFGLVGAIVVMNPGMLLFTVVSGGMAAFLGTFLRMRWRGMGSFSLDVERGELVRRNDRRELERHSLEAIVHIGKRWDPFHRDFGRHFWLVVETRDGRRYRLGKATETEVDATLALLRSWGLPAA